MWSVTARLRPVARLVVALSVMPMLWLGAARPADAHPLGNFTINHYSGVIVAADGIKVDHVIDMAEIPSFQERRGVIDADGDGTIGADEASRYAEGACARQATILSLSVDGRRSTLRSVSADVAFPPGANGLVTLRLTCRLEATTPIRIGSPAAVSFRDDSYPARIGWREIVFLGDRTTIVDTDGLRASVSARLTVYPQDLLSQPLAVAAASAQVRPGGPPLETADGQAGRDAAGPAQVPGGATDLVPELAAVLDAADPSPTVVIVALLIATGLGAYHAVTPGHGKTVMAAYLVGARGRTRDAMALAGTVAVAHTIGVLGLAAFVFLAQATLPPDRLLPWLAVVSGGIFVALGANLLRQRLADLRRRRAHERAHAQGAAHHHEPADEHGHEHGPSDSSGGRLRLRDLFALGLSGGLIPAPSALLVFLGAVGIGRPAYGALLVLAFGFGMAMVLAVIGLVVVRTRATLAQRLQGGRLDRFGGLVQLAGACVVLVVGLVVTVQAGARVL
jgi:nickel/cobalt transporter (NicO) family protein